MKESAFAITFADAPPTSEKPSPPPESHFSLNLPEMPHLSNLFSRSRTPSPEPTLTPLPPPPTPRRMVIVVVGLKPHRAGIWTTSARPSESVMYYQLLNGCPAIVVPVKLGSPLVSWDTLTLEELWKVPLPNAEGGESLDDTKFGGIVSVFCEYLDLCVDWSRVVLPTQTEPDGKEAVGQQNEEVTVDTKKSALRKAIAMLVAGAIRSGESKEVKDKVDKERSGIAMWRIP